ncbi:hypothetical protein OEZ66_12895 [Escherichia coli]|nr:hypothetical protein [Escherichia coli]
MMDRTISNIRTLFVVVSLGLFGGMFLDFWSAGCELQPTWVRFSSGAAAVVIFLNLRNALKDEKSREKRKHLERMQLAIFSIIILPLAAGFFLFMLEDISSQSEVNENLIDLVKKSFAYLPFIINCWYICLEGIVPLWRRLKCVISTKNID